jgi:hypothetical protein
MAPTFLSLKNLRRQSRASFRTETSTDTSSDGALSHDTHDTTPSSGSLTPPSHQSDPALNLQVKDGNGPGLTPAQAQNRPMMAPGGNSSRYSVSGMSGLGSPSPNGRTNLPVSQYAPRVQNISENAWVCCATAWFTFPPPLHATPLCITTLWSLGFPSPQSLIASVVPLKTLIPRPRYIKRFSCYMVQLERLCRIT